MGRTQAEQVARWRDDLKRLTDRLTEIRRTDRSAEASAPYTRLMAEIENALQVLMPSNPLNVLRRKR